MLRSKYGNCYNGWEAACVMPKADYDRIIEIERKYKRQNDCKVA